MSKDTHDATKVAAPTAIKTTPAASTIGSEITSPGILDKAMTKPSLKTAGPAKLDKDIAKPDKDIANPPVKTAAPAKQTTFTEKQLADAQEIARLEGAEKEKEAQKRKDQMPGMGSWSGKFRNFLQESKLIKDSKYWDTFENVFLTATAVGRVLTADNNMTVPQALTKMIENLKDGLESGGSKAWDKLGPIFDELKEKYKDNNNKEEFKADIKKIEDVVKDSKKEREQTKEQTQTTETKEQTSRATGKTTDKGLATDERRHSTPATRQLFGTKDVEVEGSSKTPFTSPPGTNNLGKSRRSNSI